MPRRSNLFIGVALGLFMGAGLPYVAMTALYGFSSIVGRCLFFANVFGMMLVVYISTLSFVRSVAKYEKLKRSM